MVSENGSRLSLLSTVRAPLTVTGTSSATGCGLLPVAVSSGRGLAATEDGAAVSGATVRTSSLLLGAIWMLTSCVEFLVGHFSHVWTGLSRNFYMFFPAHALQP